MNSYSETCHDEEYLMQPHIFFFFFFCSKANYARFDVTDGNQKFRPFLFTKLLALLYTMVQTYTQMKSLTFHQLLCVCVYNNYIKCCCCFGFWFHFFSGLVVTPSPEWDLVDFFTTLPLRFVRSVSPFSAYVFNHKSLCSALFLFWRIVFLFVCFYAPHLYLVGNLAWGSLSSYLQTLPWLSAFEVCSPSWA